jgi:PAS domain S-box-containing protein
VESGDDSKTARADDAAMRAVMDSMLDPTISTDVRGTIVSASESVQRVFGYVREELIGRNIKVLMAEPHHSLHDGYLAKYRRTRETTIVGRTRDFEVLKKDGSRIICSISVSRTEPHDGVHEVFTGVFRDVTANRQAEIALRQSELRFHAIFDHAYQYLGLLSTEGRLLEANQTALEATGIARDEAIGKYFWDTRWWSYSKESQEQLRAAVRAAAAGEFVRFETVHRGIGDTIIEVDFSLKPVKDETGNVVLLIPEGRDISDIKRAQRAETAMLRALATIGESAAVLAHEIKNPITAVNLALRAVADQLGEDHKEVLEDLVLRMKRLEQVMRRTLSFARPIELRRATLDARKLFEDTIAALRTEIARAEAQVTLEVAPTSVRFAGDAQLLGEVLSNLVLNSIEAKGCGVRILLSAIYDGKGMALIAVDDDGPGISDSVRKTLFKPFTTTKLQGNGLGLAICKKIIEEHGGTISIEDGRLSGARFAIRLPAKP